MRELTTASAGLHGEEALQAIGAAYVELMQDPELLQVQLHGFAAAPGDPDIARSCRRIFEVLAQVVTEQTDLSDDELREFFAMGMLINVMAAIDLLSLPDSWAQKLCPEPEKAQPIKRAAQALDALHRAEAVANAEVTA